VAADPNAFKSKVKVLFVSCGSKEKPAVAQANHEALEKTGIKNTFYVSPGTAHEWLTWRRSLHEFAPLLFKEDSSPSPTPPAAAPPAPGRGDSASQGARRGGERGGFGGPIELGPDDKPAFPDPPAGFNARRDNIPHGELTMVEYDSKTVGTRRNMLVYTPPGYSTGRKYRSSICCTGSAATRRNGGAFATRRTSLITCWPTVRFNR